MRGQLSSEMHNVPSIQATEFRQASHTNLPSGVAIVTTETAVGRRGLTLSSVTSICMEPPCAVVGINASSETHDAIFARRSFGVSLLGGDQEDLALRFGGREGVKGHQRFDIAPWSQGAPRRTASAKRTLRARVRFARSQGDWHAYHLCRTNYRDPALSSPAAFPTAILPRRIARLDGLGVMARARIPTMSSSTFR